MAYWLEVAAAVPEVITMDVLDANITIDEVNSAIKALKYNKCFGDYRGFHVWWWFTHLSPLPHCDMLEKWLYSSQIQGLLSPSKNKGDCADYNNYRGKSLLSLAGKIFACIILPWLHISAECILLESQCNFCVGCFIVDMVFFVCQLQERCTEQDRPLCMLVTKALLKVITQFHDFMKATVQFNGA